MGLRDARHRRPGMRTFSVLNVLWNGIHQLWSAVPPAARADMERQGGPRLSSCWGSGVRGGGAVACPAMAAALVFLVASA